MGDIFLETASEEPKQDLEKSTTTIEEVIMQKE